MPKTKFSRSGESSLFGKCTAELPKVRVPDEVHEALTKKAREAGVSLVEYIRTMACINVFGLDMVKRVTEQRLNIIATEGEEKGGHASLS